MTRCLLTLLLIFESLCCHAQEIRDLRHLRDGDLLFVVSPTPNAITEVTQKQHTPPIDHVAIYFCQEGHPMVIEANYQGVVERPLGSFLQDSPHVLVGRVRGSLDRATTLRLARSYLGQPYDYVFLPGNGAVYCSELVQLSYVDKRGRPIFGTIPMSFHDASGAITPYWADFYSRRALDVPEGQPGTNPNELSRHPRVRLKYEWKP